MIIVVDGITANTVAKDALCTILIQQNTGLNVFLLLFLFASPLFFLNPKEDVKLGKPKKPLYQVDR